MDLRGRFGTTVRTRAMAETSRPHRAVCPVNYRWTLDQSRPVHLRYAVWAGVCMREREGERKIISQHEGVHTHQPPALHFRQLLVRQQLKADQRPVANIYGDYLSTTSGNNMTSVKLSTESTVKDNRTNNSTIVVDQEQLINETLQELLSAPLFLPDNRTKALPDEKQGKHLNSDDGKVTNNTAKESLNATTDGSNIDVGNLTTTARIEVFKQTGSGESSGQSLPTPSIQPATKLECLMTDLAIKCPVLRARQTAVQER
ncbi:hypothetical protein C0Q70_13966 [Pomacea canaliculata]|uniref:Uncharacterized protein n=1 Tax=Pomacea canaliculata TaxID=400727 RepID=A0A2T7NYP3_POMCA|nr:hypothetical protein C0Q70_13966 [Pomacea canaliculata]